MSAASSASIQQYAHGKSTPATLTRFLCIFTTIAFVALLLVMPLISVFYEAFATGWKNYKAAILDDNSLHAIKMTLIVAAVAVPLNSIFGLAAAWAIAKFNFRGKTLLTTIIDLPFAVSPVISGLIFILIFGRQGLIGPWLNPILQKIKFDYPAITMTGDHSNWIFPHFYWEHLNGIRIIFGLPGIILATLFVTFPFVARELIPLMQEQGSQEEQAAISLGASGWQTFRRITLPNIKWGMLYGVILCNARAMGEFGAVTVITQNIPGEQNTLPREIENLYSNYGGLGISGAFALSSLLAMLGLVTLVAKSLLEWKIQRDQQEATAT